MGREYLRPYVHPRRRALIGIAFPRDTRFDALPFSADSTMSIGSRKLLRELRMDFLRSTTDDEGHLNARLK